LRPRTAVTLTTLTKAWWIVGAMVGTIVTARVLGPQGRGIIAATSSWVALFATFGHLSLAQVIVYLLGARDRERRLPVVAGSAMAVTAAISLLGWAVAAALHAATGGAIFQHVPLAALAVGFAGLPLLLWMENGNSLLIVLGDLERLNVAQLVGTTTGVVLVVLAVGVAKLGVTVALAATVVSYVVADGLGLARVLRAARPLTVSRAVVGELVAGGARLHAGSLGAVLYTHAGVVLLNHFRPAAETGYFQLALQLAAATQIVPMAIAVVVYSIVTRDGPDAAWPEHRRFVGLTMVYAAAAVAGSYLVAPLIVPLLAGRGFAPAVPVFRIACLSVFGMSLANVMAPQWVGRGWFLRSAALSLGAGAIGVAGNFAFVPRYGMTAAAWMMVVSYTLHMVGNVAFAWWIETRAT
jgi:O-antigen/teichoic acid export membrane protein